MIKSVTVTNSLGESKVLELTRPDLSGLNVKSITGLGPMKASINLDDLASMDGSTFNSARVGTRNIVLTLGYTPYPTIEDCRHKAYKMFPVKKPLTLTFETDTRNVQISGYVESNEVDIFSADEGSQVSIVCPDPNFYSAGAMQTTVFSGVSPCFEFPFWNDSLVTPLLETGIQVMDQRHNVYYAGDITTGAIFRVKANTLGVAENVAIYNVRTGAVMGIDSDKDYTSVLDRGNELIITTLRGQKSVQILRNGVYLNKLNALKTGATWLTVEPGDNDFAITATSGLEFLIFQIENPTIYEGV